MNWLRKLFRCPRGNDTEILQLLYKIMSAISLFAEKQNAHNARMSAALGGIVSDIDGLNELIQKLQTTPGPISAEDQATLDSLEAAGEALAARVEETDHITAPVVPAA